ncbi:MAG: M23 family metallopeptidase [Deltaproteobacteria bacterium]|nr:M23 family metallopeptidase [Deltaproteobacteria bacterium]
MGELTLSEPLSNAVISSPYGWRTLRSTGTRKFHYGTDYEANVGTSVKASESGKVIRASEHEALGEVVIIDHAPKAGNRRHIYTLYAHLSTYSVSQGDKVYIGDEIGLSGNTGHSTGPHLHFAVID